MRTSAVPDTSVVARCGPSRISADSIGLASAITRTVMVCSAGATTAVLTDAVVAPAEHTVTVRVMADETPIESAEIRLGPHRATTGVSGTAEVRIGKGRHELAVWKAGYEVPVMPVEVRADAVIEVAAVPLPDDDPDSYWTRA